MATAGPFLPTQHNVQDQAAAGVALHDLQAQYLQSVQRERMQQLLQTNQQLRQRLQLQLQHSVPACHQQDGATTQHEAASAPQRALFDLQLNRIALNTAVERLATFQQSPYPRPSIQSGGHINRLAHIQQVYARRRAQELARSQRQRERRRQRAEAVALLSETFPAKDETKQQQRAKAAVVLNDVFAVAAVTAPDAALQQQGLQEHESQAQAPHTPPLQPLEQQQQPSGPQQENQQGQQQLESHNQQTGQQQQAQQQQGQEQQQVEHLQQQQFQEQQPPQQLQQESWHRDTVQQGRDATQQAQQQQARQAHDMARPPVVSKVATSTEQHQQPTCAIPAMLPVVGKPQNHHHHHHHHWQQQQQQQCMQHWLVCTRSGFVLVKLPQQQPKQQRSVPAGVLARANCTRLQPSSSSSSSAAAPAAAAAATPPAATTPADSVQHTRNVNATQWLQRQQNISKQRVPTHHQQQRKAAEICPLQQQPSADSAVGLATVNALSFQQRSLTGGSAGGKQQQQYWPVAACGMISRAANGWPALLQACQQEHHQHQHHQQQQQQQQRDVDVAMSEAPELEAVQGLMELSGLCSKC